MRIARTMLFRAGGLAVLLVLWAGCKPPVEVPVADAGYQGPCPDGFYFVPAGTFEMGINPNDDLHGYDIPLIWDLMPRRTVFLNDYCIQKTEVTVEAFRSCVENGRCTEEYRDRTMNGNCNLGETPADDRDDHPINCVSWAAARQFCEQWEGGDLPTDAQWEKAARGTDQRLFPWGNEPLSCDRANWDADGDYNEETSTGGNLGCLPSAIPATWPVGTIPQKGDSPYGLKDMSGNVSEWVLDCYDDASFTCDGAPCIDPGSVCDDGSYAVRGGDAQTCLLFPFTVVAHHRSSEIRTEIGFRCVALPLQHQGD